jgi:outer membrane protein TolC
LEKLNSKNIDIRISIAQAYYNALLQTQLTALAKDAQQRFQNYYAVAKSKNQLGTIERTDLLQTELDYRNSILATQKAHQSFEASVIQLCYEINIEVDTALELTDGIETPWDEEPGMNETPSERTEVRQLGLQKDGFLLQAKKASWGTLPSVSFFANYSAQSQYNQISYFNQPWNNYNYLGLKLSLPVSDLLVRKTNIQTYLYNSTQTHLLQQNQAHTVDNEILQAKIAYQNSRSDLQTAAATLAVAKEIASLLNRKYALGATLYTQILDAEKSIQTGQNNYITALYDYLLAKVAYQKALGVY